MAESVSGDATSGIFEPLKPPFQALSDTNEGPLIMVVSIPMIAVACLTVLVKSWTAYGTTRRLGVSDATAISAMALGIGYTIALNQSVQQGLGRAAVELNESMTEALGKSYLTSSILLVLALACAKATVIVFIINIKPQRLVRLASFVILGASILWGVASAIAIGLQCGPNRWVMGPDSNNTCVNQRAMQVAIRASDVLLDVAIVMLPVFMMVQVQTSTSKRFWVITLFATRIFTPIMTGISITTLSDFYNAPNEDRPFQAVAPAIWTSVALGVSIITACIPCIKRFLADWASGLSHAMINESFEMEHTASGSRTRNQEYASGSGWHGSLVSKLRMSRLGGGAEVSSKSFGRTQDSERGANPERAKGHSEDTSDSVKGLVDGVIIKTTDWRVDYEDAERTSLDGNGSTDSGRGTVPKTIR